MQSLMLMASRFRYSLTLSVVRLTCRVPALIKPLNRAVLRLQASRDEGFDVDEGLAEQDATSLIEVKHLWEMSP